MTYTRKDEALRRMLATPPESHKSLLDLRREELLRRALTTPPISNEAIVKRSKESRKKGD